LRSSRAKQFLPGAGGLFNFSRNFAELGAGSLAVGIALVVLIPFLRKLITDKAETIPGEVPTTVVPVV
jgi:hypothetical protein